MKRIFFDLVLIMNLVSCSEQDSVFGTFMSGVMNFLVAIVILVLVTIISSLLSVLFLDKPCRDQLFRALKCKKKSSLYQATFKSPYLDSFFVF